MIYDENVDACITLENEVNNNQNKHSIISFYDKYPTCEGDLLVRNEIYEVKNPFWISDTFVFCKIHYENVFLKGALDKICYIKLNSANQIEEIGADFENRFRFDDYESLLDRKDVIHATNLHKILFSVIGDEYFLKR